MKRVLITGGSGFFGIALVEALLDKNYQVRVLDLEPLDKADIKQKIEFIKGDIRDYETVTRACKNVNIVVHNAAVLPVSRSSRKFFWDVNVGGTRCVLEEALANSVEKVIYISSSAPYGIPVEVPITEKTPFNPVCNYGKSKIAAERVCNEYRKRGLDIVILRPRTIVGKGRLGLFQILFSWIADNKNIYVIGAGKNLFQYLSESDLIDACLLSIERDCRNEDFNLGSDEFKTVKEGLQGLIDYVGSRSKVVPVSASIARFFLRILDKLNLVPLTSWHYMTADKPFYFDISKAKNILGWKPQEGTLDMLKESYDWYISHRKEVDSEFGVTHRKSLKQKFLKVLKKLS